MTTGALPAPDRRVLGARRSLLRWLAWFTAANSGCAGLVGVRYLWLYDWPSDAIGIGYPFLAFVGQSALLAFACVFLPAASLTAVWPNRRAVVGLAVFTAAAMLTLLFLDVNVFAEYRYHLDPLTAALFEPVTWLAAGLQFLILLVFESLLARILARWLVHWAGGAAGRWLAAGLVTCWVAGYGIYVWADAVAYVPVTQFTRYLPLYFPQGGRRRLAKLGLIKPGTAWEADQVGELDAAARQLRYPLSPLFCRAVSTPNLMVILIDALRPEVVHPQLTPTLVGLSRQSLVFRNHWSGGNSSRMGIFSLMYGLPGTYWQAFDGLQRPPVLMDELRKRGYAFVLSSAAGFGSPAQLDRTVFAGVSGLPPEREGDGKDRNRAVTRDWLRWLEESDTREPFFAFLYYDPPLQNMAGEGREPLALDDRYPAAGAVARRWRQYRLAARFVDGEVATAIDSLRARGLWDRTVLIVTSDHGYEFDDSGLGYVGHANAFTPYQLRTPLIVHWPGKTPQEFTHRTSHHDLPPTLLGEVFGCTNEPGDYSVGRNLFEGQDWPWLIAGSYNSYAIVAPDMIIVSQNGLVEIRGPDYRPRAHLDTSVVSDALGVMARFYR
jgi:uncharacterized protein